MFMPERHWYRLTPVSVLLIPLSLIYCALAVLRRWLFRASVLRSTRLPVPVIVVGNITVGGTGKTPLVIWLANFLRQSGYRPGVVTRGYRGQSQAWPLPVQPQTTAGQAGDEAILLARYSGCPVIAGPDRVASAMLHIQQGCNVILSDDGLQHYRLARDIEISVVDGERRFGNGLCLPAGPLREPVSRSRSATIRVANGAPAADELGMTLDAAGFYNLHDPRHVAGPEEFRAGPVHALAGIGNPERFFSSLRALGLSVYAHAFPDHHDYKPEDLDFGDERPLIMTEKDAVKCQPFAKHHYWVLAVKARPDEALGEQILIKLKEILSGQEAA